MTTSSKQFADADFAFQYGNGQKITTHVSRNARSAHEIISLLASRKDSFWLRERERRALRLFQKAARRVPAYRDYLKKNSINPEKIKTFADFQIVPPTTKKDYIKKYPIPDLLWDGSLEKPLTFSSSTGSTGEPSYFPRSRELDWEASVIHEVFLKNSSYGSRAQTLVLDCFGMGVWIAGMITYKAFEMASHRGYPVVIMTPGLNKLEIFKILKNLAPFFEQVILAGYPPLLKDIIDEAPREKVNLKKLNPRLLFAAEAFTEQFRDYVVRKAGVKNACLDTLNIYGTADIGAMAYETPATILMRRLASKDPKIFENIFGQIYRTPTLTQYNPFFITFEAAERDIILTGDNALPLIRYAVGDHGGVLSYGEVMQKFKAHGVDFLREARRAGIKNRIFELPLVYVYERDDFSTTLYGLQIYPETVRTALFDKTLAKNLTGKFTLMTRFDKRLNQYLEINLELQKGRHPTQALRDRALEKIVFTLRSVISEYRELCNHLKERALPRIVLWPAEDPLHFTMGTKQKWVKK